MTGSWDLIGPPLAAGLAAGGPGVPAPVLAQRPEEAGLIGAARCAAADRATGPGGERDDAVL
jgi:hypothetical protein